MNGETVAESDLVAVDSNGRHWGVTLRVGRPRPHERPGGDWGCGYEIDGFGDTVHGHAYGVDGLRALTLALERLGIDLDLQARQYGLRMNWTENADTSTP